MRNRLLGSMLALAALVAVVPLIPVLAAGQTPTARAKAWVPPRTPDGQPDIQGFWGGFTLASYSLEEGMREAHKVENSRQSHDHVIVDPADGKIPYQPWSAAKKMEIFHNHTNPKPEHLDPQTRCFLSSVPRLAYQSEFQVIQPPGYVVFLYEFEHAYRVIPLGARPPLGEDIKLWVGNSRGHWEGNTLVVDVTNLNDRTWLDIVGTFHSDALHVIERYTFADADTIHYEATVEDPKVFTRPWKIALPLARIKENGYELLEYACYEGNRSVDRILRK